jgi:FkbM family methyltransferase
MLTNVATNLYKSLVRNYAAGSSNYYIWVLEKLRYLWLKYNDPKITMLVRGHEFVLPFSHQFPLYTAVHPKFDTALPRLAQFVYTRDSYLSMIDIGANTGVITKLVSSNIPGDFLCVEPDGEYFSYLQLNTSTLQSVIRIQAVCGELSSRDKVSLRRSNGTGFVSIEHTLKDSLDIPVTTLDSIVHENSRFAKTNLIKVDTEGYDYQVIRGASQLLSSNRPVLFFELHPQFLKRVGADVLSIFPFLAERGYTSYIVYDNFGSLVEPKMLYQMSELAHLIAILEMGHTKDNRGNLINYFDIVAFPNIEECNRFLLTEQSY